MRTIAAILAIAAAAAFAIPLDAQARLCKCERNGQVEAPFALP
jgi:hypothetical protein